MIKIAIMIKIRLFDDVGIMSSSFVAILGEAVEKKKILFANMKHFAFFLGRCLMRRALLLGSMTM